jgi:nitrogen fixation NifU-like protein
VRSADLLDHYRRPRNLGALPAEAPDVGTGEARDERSGARVRLQVRVAGDGTIAEARFKAFGCSATIAAASYTTERITGAEARSAAALDAGTIAEALGLPETRLHAALLVARALQAALQDREGKGGARA